MPTFRSRVAVAVCALAFAFAAARTSAQTITDSTRFEQRIAGTGQVALMLSNFGFLGTNYSSRLPSFAYPYPPTATEAIDHMVRGGLWVGAINLDEGTARVTTGALDGSAGSDPRTSGGPEWTPREFAYKDAGGNTAYKAFLEFSTLPNSDQYDTTYAISEQDLITRYGDPPKSRVGGGEEHTPLVTGGVEVRQRSLSWSFEPSNKFVLIEYTIFNPSVQTLDSVYVGVYTELATANKNAFETFPPSPLGLLFQRKDIVWVDSLKLLEEHHYLSGQAGAPPSWCGIKFLGVKGDTLAGVQRTLAFRWFNYEPASTERNSDPKRFRIMTTDRVDDTESIEANEMCARTTGDPNTCDPVTLLAHGPFRLSPGDSVTVAFGFLGGDDERSLRSNAVFAQRAYDLGYRVPQPPPSPGLVVTPGTGTLTLRWDASPEIFRDRSRITNQVDFEGYRVYISEDGRNYNLIRDVDVPDSVGFNSGLSALLDPNPVPYKTRVFVDPITGQTTTRVDSTKYVFTIGGLKTGFRYWVAVTAYDFGDPLNNAGSLESGITQNATVTVPGPSQVERDASEAWVFPNPYKGAAAWDGRFARDKLIWFVNLPQRAEIKIYTLPGDLVQTIPFDARTYSGENSRLLQSNLPPGAVPPALSGTMAAWNMISKSEQEVASGLYLFSVTDLDTGKASRGHFVVIK